MRNDDDLLLLEEVAALCRTNVSSVRLWIKQGRLRSLRPGRRRLVKFADLKSFLQRAREAGATGDSGSEA